MTAPINIVHTELLMNGRGKLAPRELAARLPDHSMPDFRIVQTFSSNDTAITKYNIGPD